MLNLWLNNLCIEKYHELWDGGGANLVRNVEEKMLKMILKDVMIRWGPKPNTQA
jgi:hypothetical protein